MNQSKKHPFDETGDITPDFIHDKDESEFMVNCFNKSDDDYDLYGFVHLGGMSYEYAGNTENADDAMALDYDSSNWSTTGADESNVTLDYYSDDGDVNMEYEDYDPEGGCAASVDVEMYDDCSEGPCDSFLPECDLYMQTTIQDERENSSDIKDVQLTYVQNQASSSILGGVTISVGPIGLQIDRDSGTSESWKAQVATCRDCEDWY